MDNTISFCMIVKNEENHIKRCLESIKNIADEIIIVDTGSTDKTLEIAKSYNTKIIEYKWENNFSDARNKSLENATKNWIFVIDADEEILYEDGLMIKETLKQYENYEGFYIRLENYIYDISTGDAVVLRLFKNNSNYRFEGKIHEQIVQSIKRQGNLNKIASTKIKLLHYGYDPNKSDIELKQKRNIEILNGYDESERDGYYYFSLGNEYARINQYDKALELYKKCEEDCIKESEGIPSYAYYLAINTVKVLSSCKRYYEELEYIARYKEKYKNFKMIYFYECLAYIECGRYSEAKNSLNNYLNCNQGKYEYPLNDFSKKYDIKKLMKTLDDSSVKHEKNILSVLILLNNYDANIIETIKKCNEIADEIIIVTNIIDDSYKSKIESRGPKVISISSCDRKDMFVNGYKACSCSYVLLINSNESLSTENQYKLIKALSSSSCDKFNLKVANLGAASTSSEFRLFKNNDKLKSFCNFEEYVDYFNIGNIEDINVLINISNT